MDFNNLQEITNSCYVQVVNGIMERSDWATTITTPIGMLPTGSGNALCSSLLYEAGYVP